MTITTKEDTFSIALNDIETTQKVCEKLLKTPHYSKLGADGIYAVVAKAKSLNIHPLEALNGGLYYVQGKVGMSAEMMASLIRQCGHSIIKDPKSDNSICILHGKRTDNGDTWTVVFSMDDAKRAGLAKNMYDKYPAVMLYNRAMSMLARQLFPDIIKGAGYTMDELQEIAGGRKFGDNKEKVIEIQETKPVEFLSDEQCTELSKVFAECDTAYIQKVWDTLDKMGIATYKEIPSSMYERIFMAAVKNRDEYRSSKEKPTSMDELIEAI